ncbi:MAG: replication restart helicase PriA [Burkholderiaceae bacterium]
MDESQNSDKRSEQRGEIDGQYALTWLDMPIAEAFDYRVPEPLNNQIEVGDWIVVPWARRQLIGVVAELRATPGLPPERIKSVIARLPDAPRLPASWFELGRFAAAYYHRHPGEIMLPGLPKSLRVPPKKLSSDDLKPNPTEADIDASVKPAKKSAKSVFERARAKFDKNRSLTVGGSTGTAPQERVLTAAQDRAVEALKKHEGFAVHVLHGITGSGKTEVYLQWISTLLTRDPGAQVLLLVPEIGLTPQLATTVAAYLDQPTAMLHSGLAEGARAANWLAAAEGRARIVIGTRLAILAPLPGLAAVVVDEEHDSSFKQAEGAHYSARDLAIVVARQANVPIVLGSATPAYETWHSAQTGRFGLHQLPERASGAPLPRIRIETLHDHPRAIGSDNSRQPSGDVEGLCPGSVTAMHEALARGEQVMVFINRRGYAPVLSCRHCGWLSECDDCSAYRVLHRLSARRGGTMYRLICHHCGSDQQVPTVCPSCGDVDLQPLGRGTQRVEEILAAAFPQARIARLDRDVARRRGATDQVLQSIHDGEVDIILGTQMLTKGHDFQRLNLVVVLDADGGLFAADFRAPERLFAMLMQVAGRAGRHTQVDADSSQVIVQTRFPDHPVFAALMNHDYAGFAAEQLNEREAAALPPFSYQALVKVEAASIELALQFLGEAARLAQPLPDQISVYDPVPMPMARLAGRGRAQLLVESPQRARLHHFISGWQRQLPASTARLRWQLEIDPAEI